VQQTLQGNPVSLQHKPPTAQKKRNRAPISFVSWMNKFFAAQERVRKAEYKLKLQSKLCPIADRCRDRRCRRRKRCRKVAAAALAVAAARARLSVVSAR
jgi:hypothetical protein